MASGGAAAELAPPVAGRSGVETVTAEAAGSVGDLRWPATPHSSHFAPLVLLLLENPQTAQTHASWRDPEYTGVEPREAGMVMELVPAPAPLELDASPFKPRVRVILGEERMKPV